MKIARTVFRVICLSILLMAVFQIAFMKPSQSAEVEKSDESSASLIKKLDEREAGLEQRERDLDEREFRIKEREKELDKKLVKMEELRQAVSGELDAQRKNNEEKVLKMVAVFETMSPKSAAGVLETIDDWLAVEVLKKMDVKRVAKVMNTMDKNRSAKLSELMTGYYHPEADRKVSSLSKAGQAGDVSPSVNTKKGGEK